MILIYYYRSSYTHWMWCSGWPAPVICFCYMRTTLPPTAVQWNSPNWEAAPLSLLSVCKALIDPCKYSLLARVQQGKHCRPRESGLYFSSVKDDVRHLRLNVFARDTPHRSMLTKTGFEIPRRENKRPSARSASRVWQVPSFGSATEMSPVQRTMSDLRSRAEGKENKYFQMHQIVVSAKLVKRQLHLVQRPAAPDTVGWMLWWARISWQTAEMI